MNKDLFQARVIRAFCISMLVSLLACPPAWARQVVTDDLKSWAREAIEREKKLGVLLDPNTVAVLYFKNDTGQRELDILQKGMTVMLMTDLSKIKGLHVLERARIQALMQELRLGASGLVERDTASRLGRLLHAEHLVGGEILREPMGEFGLRSDLIKVSTKSLLDRPSTRGKLLEGIFRMEKDLLFKIVRALNITLTPEEEEALKKPVTTDLDALLKLFEGIEQSDQGNYGAAMRLYEQALEDDPGFWLARSFLEELRDLYPEGYSPPEAGAQEDRPEGVETAGPLEDPRDRDLADLDNDGDGLSETDGDCNDSNPAIHPGAMEIAYDGIDQDCDGRDLTDVDGDGFAAIEAGGPDCNDQDPNVNPQQTESCNGIDDNCNGQIDEGVLNTYWIDSDGDGFGDPNQTTQACHTPPGATNNNLDCNDQDPEQHPGAWEVCNGQDDDCDGQSDEGCEYLLGGQPPIVDMDSVNMAQDDVDTDLQLDSDVQAGLYEPGQFQAAQNSWGFEWTGPYGLSYNWAAGTGMAYLPGLQLVGTGPYGVLKAFVDPDTLDRINSDPFLAYSVQVEEDRLNREILEMKRRAWQADQVDDVVWQLQNGDIRTRDDYLMQKADAQAGRVLVDRDGNWVRVQQYVLRHEHQDAAGNPVTSIQVLNVCLRGGSGPQAGLSSLEFTTNLDLQLQENQDLRQLPWHDWLDTEGPQQPTQPPPGYPPEYRYVYSPGGLESMYVLMESPGGRHLKESRSFAPVEDGIQRISQETLELAIGSPLDGTYNYTGDWLNAGPGEYWVYHDGDFVYSPQGHDPAPFYYMYRYGQGQDQVGQLASMEFHVLGDGDTPQNRGISGEDYSWVPFTDIWDSMRANVSETTYIGQNNLEMVLRQGLGGEVAVDIVYIPLPNMIWRTDKIYTDYWDSP